MGFYGEDSPLDLIEKMVNDASDKYGEKVEAVLILGDYIQHNFDIGVDGTTKEGKFEIISAMWSNLTQLVMQKFPNVPIISAFGNNDNLKDYIPPGSIDPVWKSKVYD